jgi:protein tyrosine/serine phosphatase
LDAQPRWFRSRLAILVRALLLALALVVGAEAARTGLGSNFHTVVPGRCYRCAQPAPDDLRLLARTLGIRSIVNLRGFDDRPWYEEERAIADGLGMAFVDAGIWAAAPPSAEEFQTVVRAVDESPEPMLIHCQSGIDRSGLAAALFLLLRTDTPLERATSQLSPLFGHNPWGRAGCQDAILAAYAAWLAEHGLTHRPDHLRRWTAQVYQPPS